MVLEIRNFTAYLTLQNDSFPILPSEKTFSENLLSSITQIYLSAVIFLGILGNLFTLLIIFGTKLREIPPNHYLASLSVSDTVFLFALFLIWLQKLELGLHSIHWCHLVIYTLNVSSWQSSWSIMALAIERYIVIIYPVSSAANSEVGRVRKIVLSILPFPLLFNIWVFIMIGYNENWTPHCNLYQQYYKVSSILNAIDMILVFIIPSLFVVFLNIAVGISIIRG